jgi:hypothetical protein
MVTPTTGLCWTEMQKPITTKPDSAMPTPLQTSAKPHQIGSDNQQATAALLAALESAPPATEPRPILAWEEDASYFRPERCTPLDDF